MTTRAGSGLGLGLGLGLGAGARGSGWTPVCVYIVREIYTRTEASLKVAGKKGGVRGQEREREGGFSADSTKFFIK